MASKVTGLMGLTHHHHHIFTSIPHLLLAPPPPSSIFFSRLFSPCPLSPRLSPSCKSHISHCISSLTVVGSAALPGLGSRENQGPLQLEVALDALDIRVGKIVRAWKHPEADSLYVEEVDIGEPAGARTICSGLVKYVPEQELQDRAVVVLANLKPRNMRGVKSNGMLLAASDAFHENVELLTPPNGSMPGERIWFGSESGRDRQADAATPNQMQKKKIWETIQPHLKTNEDSVATFRGTPMRTSAGLVACKSLKEANIS